MRTARPALAAGVAALVLGAAAAAAPAVRAAPAPTTATSAPPASPPPAPAPPAPAPPPAAGIPLPPFSPSFDVPDAPVPEAAATGVDDLLRGPDLRRGDDPTFYERYGSGGFTLDSTLGFRDVTDKAVNAIAAAVFGVVVWLASAVTKLFQWAFSVELFGFVGDAVNGIVGSLRETLYAPFLQAFIVMAGVYGLWHGLVRRRGTVAAEGWVWVTVALVAATVFFSHPGAIVDTASKASIGLSRGVLAGTSVVDPKDGPDDGVLTKASFSGELADTQLRVAADRFWRTFVYAPWQVIELGSTSAGRRYGERLLAAKTLTPDETRRAESDPDAAKALREAKAQSFRELRGQLEDQDPDAWEWFQGHRSAARVAVALLAAVAVLMAGALLVVLSGAVLLAQLAVLLLVLLAPLFLLAGVQPGTGRIVAIRWLETLAGALMKQVLFATLLAVVLVVSGVLLDATYGLGWGMAMAMQVLVVLAAIVYRKPFARIFANVGMPGGSGAPHTVEDRASVRTLQPALQRVRRTASVTGAVVGGYVGRKVARGDGAASPEGGDEAAAKAPSGPDEGVRRPRAGAGATRAPGNGTRVAAGPPPNRSGEPLASAAVASRNRQRADAWRARLAQGRRSRPDGPS